MRVDLGPSVTCRDAAPVLPALLDDPAAVNRAVTRHVASCLRCQAEVARYRRTRRLLRQLHPDLPLAPGPDPGEPDLEVAAAASPARRLALAGGIAAAALAAAATVTVTVVGRGRTVRAARAS